MASKGIGDSDNTEITVNRNVVEVPHSQELPHLRVRWLVIRYGVLKEGEQSFDHVVISKRFAEYRRAMIGQKYGGSTGIELTDLIQDVHDEQRVLGENDNCMKHRTWGRLYSRLPSKWPVVHARQRIEKTKVYIKI